MTRNEGEGGLDLEQQRIDAYRGRCCTELHCPCDQKERKDERDETKKTDNEKRAERHINDKQG